MRFIPGSICLCCLISSQIQYQGVSSNTASLVIPSDAPDGPVLIYMDNDYQGVTISVQ